MIRRYMLKLLGKWLLMACGALAVLYLCGVVAGSLLSGTIEASDSIVINRPPETVWWVLSDHNSAALWDPQYKYAQTTSAPGDKPTRWRATYTDGYVVNVEVKEETYPSRVVEQISDNNLP